MKRKLVVAIGLALFSITIAGCADQNKSEPETVTGEAITSTEETVESTDEEVSNTENTETEEISEEMDDSSKSEAVTDKESAEDVSSDEKSADDKEADASTEEKTYTSESSSQLELLSDCLDTMKKEYLEAIYDGQAPRMAVTDLNRNGRLELLFTDCQGSGAFSYTCIYEVNEDYTGVTSLPVGGSKGLDESGDFALYDRFECYKKGDSYYYEVMDYTSAGWSCKGESFYAYSFDGKVEARELGGFISQIVDPDDQETFHVNLWGPEDRPISDEESFWKNMDAQWEGYTKQPGCAVNWISLSEEGEAYKLLTDSYKGFKTDVEMESERIDFRLQGDDYNYVIDAE